MFTSKIVSIPDTPQIAYQWTIFTPTVRNSPALACYSHLTPEEQKNFSKLQLSSDRALDILKKVEWRAEVNAFLYRPFVLLSVGAFFAAPFLLLSNPCLLLDIAIRISFMIGATIFGLAFDSYRNKMHARYEELNRKVKECIASIQNTSKAQVTLDLPLLKQMEGN